MTYLEYARSIFNEMNLSNEEIEIVEQHIHGNFVTGTQGDSVADIEVGNSKGMQWFVEDTIKNVLKKIRDGEVQTVRS